MIPKMHRPYLDGKLTVWGWSWRLMLIALQVIAAYWMAQPNDSFFYQGF